MSDPDLEATITAMELINPARQAGRTSRPLILVSTLVGALLVAGGVGIAYLVLATPLMTAALPSGRPSAGQMVIGMGTWALALVAPAVLVLFGTSRLARILATVRGNRPPRSTALRGLKDLPDDVFVASAVTLPDGRGASNLVLGRFGVAVVRELPPTKVTRIREGSWELRTARGWISIENPLERATRDAERVRRWMAGDDSDFIVKVYAAVVGPDPQMARTAACAVLSPDQLAAWVSGLPPQRSLTESRRQRMVDSARTVAA